MPRRALLVLLACWWLLEALSAQSAPEAYTLAVGRFGATDQEIQECYFNIGPGAMLVLHPNGEPCVIARGLIGRTGKLIFVPDP